MGCEIIHTITKEGRHHPPSFSCRKEAVNFAKKDSAAFTPMPLGIISYISVRNSIRVMVLKNFGSRLTSDDKQIDGYLSYSKFLNLRQVFEKVSKHELTH